MNGEWRAAGIYAVLYFFTYISLVGEAAAGVSTPGGTSKVMSVEFRVLNKRTDPIEVQTLRITPDIEFAPLFHLPIVNFSLLI